jgi:hypothetical protein
VPAGIDLPLAGQRCFGYRCDPAVLDACIPDGVVQSIRGRLSDASESLLHESCVAWIIRTERMVSNEILIAQVLL